jgi:hypothetical protein
MEVTPDLFETAKSHFFDTNSWRAFCDVTLTLSKRARDSGGWVKLHCAIELPPHFDAIALEKLIRDCSRINHTASTSP